MRKLIANIATVASLSLAAVPILGLTQAANAAEPNVRVPYGDLNLANPAQAKLFQARIDAAGETLCRAKLRAGTLDLPMRSCVVEVNREVERQLSSQQRQALTQAASAHEIAAR